ncbi:phosphotransferase enzyme family protein [Streptomyces endophyticus]|uniref:Phosphotransferase n=1 Tax=Streptomyces endophyticus TaxID=714166 RepID=A0ABU6EZZ3_9ACTN|nr:phosphotransferase [Streptomyces endophyticus]MEB8336177.1 phosphotransferase [Streptomyces endophyticus]
MRASEASRAVGAARFVSSPLGLIVHDVMVLHNSNKLTLRLLPCDVLARVAPVDDQIAEFEVGLAQRLAEAGCPVAALDPRGEARVHERDGFVVTLWTYYESVATHDMAPDDYALALARLHSGMRKVDAETPHFTERVAHAQRLLADRERTPDLSDVDRELLRDALRRSVRTIGERGGGEQLLHGEPHPGNVLATRCGPVFIDLETCCRGPVELDLAHAPEDVAVHYPGVDQELLRACRILVLAVVTTWRWDRYDQYPRGRAMGLDWLGRIRAALG